MEGWLLNAHDCTHCCSVLCTTLALFDHIISIYHLSCPAQSAICLFCHVILVRSSFDSILPWCLLPHLAAAWCVTACCCLCALAAAMVQDTIALARLEGLEGHARSAEQRISKPPADDSEEQRSKRQKTGQL